MTDTFNESVPPATAEAKQQRKTDRAPTAMDGVLTGAIVALAVWPIVRQILQAFQVAPLPRFFGPLATLLLALGEILVFGWILVLLAIPFACALSFWRGLSWRMCLLLAAIWLLAWSSAPLADLTDGFGLRTLGLKRIATRAQPLIDGIESYHQKGGGYPQNLEALIPTYLPEIPYTGAVGYPEFEYECANKGNSIPTYELRIPTSTGLYSYDHFIYWPGKDYAPEKWPGQFERIGSWLYIHDEVHF